MYDKSVRIIEDIVSLVVLRIFAKRKKHMMSESDFDSLANLGAAEAIGIVTVRNNAKDLEEMITEEIRRAVELIARKGCGRCKGAGILRRQGIQIMVCPCLNMVHYRGDGVLPLGEQYSNAYFEDELSKNELGKKDLVINIANSVGLFLRGQATA